MNVELATGQVETMAEWWWNCWMGMHWGFRRHAAVYWCCSGQISPFQADEVLGIDISYPVDVVIFYRELVVSLVPEHDLAHRILSLMPQPERNHIQRFYAGHNVFERGKGAMRSISQIVNDVTVPAGLPPLRLTDDGAGSRIPGYRMVFEGLRRTHSMRSGNPPCEPGTTPLLFISAACPELIAAIPSLEYDLREKEDIRMIGTEQDDVWQGCMNTYRDYPATVAAAPLEVRRLHAVNRAITPTGRYMNLLQFNANNETQRRPRKH